MKTTTSGHNDKKMMFAAAQEAVGTEVESVLGVLMARVLLLAQGCRSRFCDDLEHLMKT